jgi:NADH-quinone oxidoreductase subunit J
VASLAAGFGEVASLGREMFGPWVVPFELAGILLTVALIGAVLLAKRRLDVP